MLISVTELKKYWGISPNGVLHVGAHLGEEAQSYEENNWTPVTWVEAQPNLVQKLNESLPKNKHKVIQAAVWGTEGEKLSLHVASNSMSSSLLDLGSHADSYPDITYIDQIEVSTKRLENLISEAEMPNFINIDIQGAELEAIKGLGTRLNKADYIFVEVNRKEVYKGCTLVSELDSYLQQHDFQRVGTRWFFREGWGDALYVRKTKLNKPGSLRLVQYWIRNTFFYLKQLLRALGAGKVIRKFRNLEKS